MTGPLTLSLSSYDVRGFPCCIRPRPRRLRARPCRGAVRALSGGYLPFRELSGWRTITGVIVPEDIANSDVPEIEITPEMIEAGVEAWCEGAGDEYPEHSITNHLTVIDIFRAMRKAAPLSG